MDKKQPFYYSSRFWVGFYFIVYLIFICLQFILGCLSNANFKLPTKLTKYINGEANLPMEIFSWGWAALVSLYCGFDRFVDIKTTLSLSSGQMSIGELDKLRKIICGSFFLLCITTLFSFITNKDYQLSSNATAFAMSIIIYVSGNKLCKGLKYSGKDENKDGIPDEYEKDYYKWKRQQLKDGVEERFITFEYFLDENENIRDSLK